MIALFHSRRTYVSVDVLCVRERMCNGHTVFVARLSVDTDFAMAGSCSTVAKIELSTSIADNSI